MTWNPRSTVVFSHLDSVLHDPHLPRFGRAATILREIAADGSALVLCSGKTRAELEFVQQKLDIVQPFISENGGAVYVPADYFAFEVPNGRSVAGYHAIEFGRPYADVAQLLHRAAERLRIPIVGFSDMSIEAVAQECRMPLLQARLAKLREYDEPFRMVNATPAARARLFKALEGFNLRCDSGAVFDRVGAPVDIDIGVSLLKTFYRRESPSVATAGFAHATTPHDALLGLVDYPVLVPEDDDNGGIDVVDWAEAIVDAVRSLRRRRSSLAGDADGSSVSVPRLH
jgi:mannosyl-3-phosphoglycerate phosphatase family protein